ncbi:MAG: FAD-dependent oxidoreductase, partial [Rhodovibrionaceae bacterium]
WSERTTPWDFGHELLPPDLDRIADSLAVGFQHFPAFERAGIKNVINGPFTFAPDGNPLIGPVRGLPNFYLACGVMAGFSQGGGVGLALSNWIVEGDPGMDIWAMDAARYGDWATLAYTNAKVRENYSRRFRISFPNEELPAGRPLRSTPIYDRLKARNAVFGAAYGLEHALWFAPEGMQPVEEVTYYRSNAHDPVGRECRAVREAVGLLEISNFAKYEVTGPEAESWLSHLLANRTPRTGKLILSPMLNPHGRLIGDFTLGKLEDERFYIFGSGIAEEYHLRWFESQLPDKGVSLRSLRRELVGLQIAGPQARELLSRVTAVDVANAALPFMAFRRIDIGMVPALLGRVSFTGELGYELWVAPEYQIALYDLLVEAGEDLGLTHFGGRALNSLRLEKAFGSWTREYTPDYDPVGAGLGRFTDFRKNAFIGREAALKARDDGPAQQFCAFTVEAGDADAVSDEPIFRGEDWVGFVTSGGYGHTVGQSLALGYVTHGAAEPGPGYSIEILGQRRPATLLAEAPLDPQGARLRS